MAGADEHMLARWLARFEQAKGVISAAQMDPHELERASEVLRELAGELLEVALYLDKAAFAIRRQEH